MNEELSVSFSWSHTLSHPPATDPKNDTWPASLGLLSHAVKTRRFALCGAIGDQGNVTHSTWSCYDRSRYLEHPRHSSAPRWLSPRPSGSQRRPSCCLAAPCLQPFTVFALAQVMNWVWNQGLMELWRECRATTMSGPAPLTDRLLVCPLSSFSRFRIFCDLHWVTMAGVIDVGVGQPALSLRRRHFT